MKLPFRTILMESITILCIKGQKMPYIQLEEMYIPFGVRVTNEPYEKAELTLSPYNKSNTNVTEFFKNIDKSIVKLLSTDSKKYLGKKDV